MATTTTNFGWDIPQSTDLVKDGATAIAALGQDIDTALVDLKGGTTGQVLAKASGTDLDFSWVAQDDSNAIQNAIVDAKGDLIAATAADTPARLAVGTNGYVLTADSAEATGLKWSAPGAGGMTEIATGSLSGSAVNLTSIPATYNSLRLVVRAFLPATNGTFLGLRFNNDGTANRYHEDTSNSDGLSSSNAFDGTGNRASGNQSSSTANGLIIVDIPDYANTTTWKFFASTAICNNPTTATNYTFTRINGWYNQTAAISQVNLYANSGNFTSGTYILYGVK